MPVITVSRQHGSLGDEIAKDVAAHLHLRLVDQEMINGVAQQLGISPAPLELRDERSGTIVSELVGRMQRLYPALRTMSPSSEGPEPDESSLLQVTRQVIWEVARAGDAVIVGLGSTFILDKHPDILHVLIVSPTDVRIERIMADEGIDYQASCQRVKDTDAARGRYVRRYYGTNWLDLAHYDLVVNMGHFTPLAAMSVISAAVVPE